MGDLTGETLLEKYKITGLLGRGGMGAVYQGTHLRTGRKVAVKVLDDRFLANRSIVQRFGREARSASSIQHPGIVEVLDLDQLPDGAPFLVMELLDGETLGSFIERKQRLSQSQAVEIFDQLLEALEAAHERGIVHRDLKPDNIFLLPPSHSGKRAVKILDFGISQKADEVRSHLTQTGAVLGTPHYMSPEQALGESALDACADVYAAAVVLYECVVGEVPYDAPNYNALLQAILRASPVRPRDRGAKVEPAFEAALLAGMAKEKAKRPQTAAAWRTLLLDAASGAPIREPRPAREGTPAAFPQPSLPEAALTLSEASATSSSLSEPPPVWGEFATLGKKAPPPAAVVPAAPPPAAITRHPTPAERVSVAPPAVNSTAGKELEDFGFDPIGPALELDDSALPVPGRGRIAQAPAVRGRSYGGTLPAVNPSSSTGTHAAPAPAGPGPRTSPSGMMEAVAPRRSSSSAIPAVAQPASLGVEDTSLPGGDLPLPDDEPSSAPAPGPRPAQRIHDLIDRVMSLPRAVHLAAAGAFVLGVLILAIRLAVGRGDETEVPVAPPPPPNLAAPTPPSAPEQPQTVLVDVSGLPQDARVKLDGLPVGALPLRVGRGEHHVLVIEAPGYDPRRVPIAPLQDLRISAEMRLTR